MKRTHRYTIDGRTYASLEDMPPEVRKKWDSVSALVSAMTDLAGHTTTIKFEQTIHGGDLGPLTGPGSRAEALWRAGSDQTGGFPEGVQFNSVTVRTKLISAAFLVLLFTVIALAVLAMLSTVRITVRYGPEWVAGCALVTLVLVGVVLWGLKRPRNRFPGGSEVTFGTVVGWLVGMSILTIPGILGGIPILAHHMTARPGELIVTVTGKETQYHSRQCTPRLKVDEFAHSLRDYLCPGSRAFNEIDVGTKIRLQGNVSQFGIELDRMYWTKNR